MKILNRSRQREAIYQCLVGRYDHPTADMIYEEVKNEFPNISLGTVYRNLMLLEEMGKIQRIPSNDTRDHYDGNVSEHPHFICSQCHKVMDLHMEHLEFLHNLVNPEFDGEVERSQLIFFGKCTKCKTNSKNSNNY
jgi:Fur family peroxide stress response transcriptional regulator